MMERRSGSDIRVAVDIGGTFTDLVAMLPSGEIFTGKISSTPDDYARAIIDGLLQMAAEYDFPTNELIDFLHATTIGSNAILELKGAKVGLITTRGFRDILELRRLRMPRLYDLEWEKPAPLVPRYLRREVMERVDARGGIDTPLDEQSVRSAVEFLVGENVEVVAVALLHAYANSKHEQRVRDIVAAVAPGLKVCLSSDVLPEIREYERTSTTVVNAYLLPVVHGYLTRLRSELDRIGVRAPILIMQSGGGLTTDTNAREYPVNIVESGPAAGVIGAQAIAGRLGLGKIITFDMGGTTAKASIVEDGKVTRAPEYQVGAGLMHGSRLLTGAGYLLRVPSIDLAEVGAGGGSHIRIDAGGLITVGPTSAGSHPGPLCYGLGGTEPTVTDANLLLGYLNPEALAGGSVRLDAKRARDMFEQMIARPLGASVEQAAYAAHMIATSNMIRAIKAVSSERGRDPREYSLFAFGGNGPVFAASIARALQIDRVIVPPAAGVFSSVGLLYSRIERHFVRTSLAILREVAPQTVARQLAEFEDGCRATMRTMGVSEGACVIERLASLRYRGQSFELTVPLPSCPVTGDWLVALEEIFGAEHERTYGHRAGPDEPAELVTLNFIGYQADRAASGSSIDTVRRHAQTGKANRRAYFGPDEGWCDVAVIGRPQLAGGRDGPVIIEEYDATCVVPKGVRAQLTSDGCITLDLSAEAPAYSAATRAAVT